MSNGEQSKKAEGEYSKLLDAFPQYMSICDADGKRLFANDALLDFFGFTQKDFLADDFQTRAFHPDDLGRVKSTLGDAISRGENFELEARIRRRDGRYCWILLRGRPVRDENGRIVRWYSVGTDIEDRREAQEELRQVLEAVPQHIFIVSADGEQPLYGNKVAADYFGFTELPDMDSIRQRIHPDDRSNCRESRERGISNGVAFAFETRLRHRSGSYRWHLILYNPFRDAEGRLIRWYCTATDIEDRKQAEQELQREKERLKQLLEFTNKCASKLDLGDLVRAVVESVRQMVECDVVAIFLPGADAHNWRSFVIEFTKAPGPQAELQYLEGNPPASFEESLASTVLRSRIASTGSAGNLLQAGVNNSETRGEKTWCALPIVCCDVVLGVLSVGRLSTRDFSQHDIELLQQLAAQMAIELNNALVVEGRAEAEKGLRRSESYLAEAQRLSHTGSYAHNVDGEIIYLSEEAYRTFGFNPESGPVNYEQVRGRVHPEDLHIFDACSKEVIRKKEGSTSDFRLLLPGGTIKHIHCVSRPVFDASGRVVEVVGTNMDVTEQVEARAALQNAIQQVKRLKDELYRENLALKEEIDQASMFEEIVGTSATLRRVLVHVAKVAPTNSTILITGETGTGKELIARAIHKRSPRASRPFVSVNCAAIPQALIGSELFGHEKGAFTGAMQRRLGRFEVADGGTLFLDEVGDLPPETQIALLRVLQERQFERIGGSQPISVDVRVIAATNRDLKEAVAAGTFRSDLFYRLNVFPILVPPLRERKDDIPLLVEYLIERYAAKAGKKIKNVQKKTMELFHAYDWPGNIRELQNVIERAVILCDGETFSVDESWLQPESPRTIEPVNRLSRLGAKQEKQLIEAALAATHGRVAGPSGAAVRIGIPRSTLETKIRRLGIKKHRFNPK